MFPPQTEVTANNTTTTELLFDRFWFRFPTKLTAVPMTQREGTTAMPLVGLGGSSEWFVFH
jgi:hypothetical protein